MKSENMPLSSDAIDYDKSYKIWGRKNNKNSNGEKRYDFAFIIFICTFSDYVCPLGYVMVMP